MASDAEFPALTPAELAVENALRLDGWSVVRLQQLPPAIPEIIACYNGRVFPVRVPLVDSGEVVGLPESSEEQAWDDSWPGNVIVSANANDIVTAILGTPPPTQPDTGPAQPAGLYVVGGSAGGLNFDLGTAVQTIPGGWSVDQPLFRSVMAGGATFSSAEIWFRWLGDASAASGTTRQISLIVRETNSTNALLASWRWAPTATGVYVQRQVAGVYTAEGAISTVVPPSPTDGRWHRLRVDIIGTTLTARADGIIAWQGTLSSPAQAITGAPGVQADNGRFDFLLWTPPTPSSATIIQVDVTPQGQKPQQGINTTAGVKSTDTPTYELIQSSGKTDRIRLVSGVSGFNGLGMQFSPVNGDVSISNGRRASLKSTQNQATAAYNRRCFQVHQGCRTRDTFKVRFPTGSLPSSPGYWGVLWQYHQGTDTGGPAPRTGGSPPIALNFRQHKTSNVYWIWFGLDANYYNALGQDYTTFMQSDGSWPLGGEVRWNEILQFDHTYTFVIDIYHSTLGPTDAETSTLKHGAINLLSVDGVTKVSNLVALNMYDDFNFPDVTCYEHPSITGRRSTLAGDWMHEHVPGALCPLLPFYTPP
jgi:hypothetical protein